MSSNPHGHAPHGETLHGIDVASPQGHRFDWELVAADGIRFAWMKATQGTTGQDPTFARNWRESRAHGVLRGAYHFLSPDTPPTPQAENYLRTVGDLGSDDLHPMLDVEVDRGKSAAIILAYALEWTEHVEKRLGRPVVQYTYPSFWRDKLGQPTPHPLGTRPLWIAHYVVDPNTGKVYNLKSPYTPITWADWAIWQTSGNKGPRIPGIPVDVDRDVFWGSERGFRAMFTGEPVPSEPPDTKPSTPPAIRRSSQRIAAVDAPIIEHPRDGRTQPLFEHLEGEHTVKTEDPEL